ncbi:hypothetical protein MesoLjLc_29880 [Mesorhizobium sp. L-8-10]|nr:hypothetical protein MesoLjLc_29880 [Mesorhizobium sp. L-8-10]
MPERTDLVEPHAANPAVRPLLDRAPPATSPGARLEPGRMGQVLRTSGYIRNIADACGYSGSDIDRMRSGNGLRVMEDVRGE